MAIAYFNGAEPSDVDAFEAMRGAGAFAESVVLARIRHARDEGDVWIRDDAAVLAAVRAGDVLRVDGVVATRGGGTRGADGAGAYRTHWEAIDAGTTMPGSGRSTSGSFSGERSISSG